MSLACSEESVEPFYLRSNDITFFDLIGRDLRHDPEIQLHPPLKAVEDCREFVKASLPGTCVYF